MDKTQKNPGQQPPEPNRYDYSHLRDTSKGNHWYATPNADNPAAPPPPAATPPPPVMPPPVVQQQPPPPQPAAMMPPPVIAAPQDIGGMKGSPVRQRIDQRRRRQAAGLPENWAWVVIACALLGLTIVGSIFLVIIIRFTLNNDAEAIALSPQVEPTSIIYSQQEGENVGGALDGNSLEILNTKWDGQERFTILLMGLDKRPDEEGSFFRTDTMILVSLDPVTNSIGMLSIPRDTYVEVPYCGVRRINEAYVCGELEEPGSGPRLAMQTVQYNFGIRVNEFVTVDFSTVIALVDAIGGVDIEVAEAITDHNYPTMDYGTEIFHVEAGWQHFDGTTALKYARTRHSSDDIDRARRQQQVIYAVRDKVTVGMIDDLLIQAPQLYAQLNSGINTGLSFDQLVSLALWAADVPRENIHNGVVSWEYMIGFTTEGGANVLVPHRAKIGELMVSVFGADYSQ